MATALEDPSLQVMPNTIEILEDDLNEEDALTSDDAEEIIAYFFGDSDDQPISECSLLSPEYFKNGYVRTSDRKIVSFRQNLVYGLGYIFGYHLSEVFKSSPKEFAKVYHDINTQRFDISLEEAIKMTGFDVDGFVDLKYISPRFTQESIELKRRFRPEQSKSLFL